MVRHAWNFLPPFPRSLVPSFMHPPERRALLLLLTLAVAGQAVRYLATRPGQAAGSVQLLSTFPAGSPLAHRDSAMRQARPLNPGERIDVDAAPAAELARLPRVGLSLAKTIVADRETHGPFGGLAGLDRVAGVGARLLAMLEPFVMFSGPAPDKPSAPHLSAAVGTTFAPSPRGGPFSPPSGRQGAALNVNRATAVDLEALPGIGPALAQRIVADREARGPFATVQALDRVSGIGPALVERLGTLVTAP
jgi:competence ComEA-like helix-hairpin-helix protein